MKTSNTIALPLALAACLTGLLNIASVKVHSSSNYDYKAPASRYNVAKFKESYSQIPLSFVANHGQADKKLKFISRGGGYSLALAPTTFTLAVADQRNKTDKEAIRSRASASVLRATLLGGNAAANLTGFERLPTKSNYLTGNDPRRWKTNIPNYAKVKYSGV